VFQGLKKEANSIPVAEYVEIHHARKCPCMQSMTIPFSFFPSHSSQQHPYLNLRASRSDSRRQRMSSSRTVGNLLARVLFQTLRIFSFLQYFACKLRVSWKIIPGPLTLRIMLRVVSSMNSTRTWVTPPREPIQSHIPSASDSFYPVLLLPSAKANIPVRPKTRVTLTNLTGTFDESMFAVCISISASNSPGNHHRENRYHT
jgi:hypothetical protein